MAKKITHTKLAELLSYDKSTGIFRWLVKRNSHAGPVLPGDVAGYISGGYRYICIDGRAYQASRLAFFYVKKRWPRNHMDHKNRVRDDDRFDNLRHATCSQNLQNILAHKDSISGVKGVRYDSARGKWTAKISVNRKSTFIGRFETKELAMSAYLSFSILLHPFAPHHALSVTS